jgi:hypothetical protein
MSGVGFQPTAPMSGRAKAGHGLDRAAAVIGSVNIHSFVVHA